ncbi:MAG: Gfo/Idh/MocA family oxidoreductase [Chloroflexi bacterium]|nr:Gfo/Idh/MocA family oxidoreductase [Chloroflexota bacterium]
MPGRPLRWGILSTARIARQRFIPGVRSGAEGEVVAIASRDAAKAQAVATELGIPHAHGSYEALLADPEVDAVYIGLPNGLHPEWTIKAAQAGKHVLCEKPLARRAADARRMVEACRQAGVLLMEAFMNRLHPQHARVLELIKDGAIGEPAIIRASFCFLMAPDRRAGGDVRLQRDLEGGALMDVGCYAVNAARYLFGAEPVEVSAQQRVDPAFGVDTAFAAVLRFPGDRLALVDGSFDAAGTQRYEIAGPGGTIAVERAYTPPHAPVTIAITQGGRQRTEDIPAVDQYALEADHFARSVCAGRLLPPAEDGLAQAAVIEALYRSAASGKSVRLR